MATPGWPKFKAQEVTAANLADITDNSGGTGAAEGTIAAAQSVIQIPLILPDILLTSLDTPADLVTDYVPGIAGTILRWGFITKVVATSGGTADADIDLQIGATPVTGAKYEGLTQTDFAAIGAVKQDATITAANVITAASTISIVCTESAVNFTAGEITPIIWIGLPAVGFANAFAVLAAQNKSLLDKLKASGQMTAD